MLCDDCVVTPCGGSLANTTWLYRQVCVPSNDLPSLVASVCSDITPIDVTGTITGALSFTATDFVQTLTTDLVYTAYASQSCGTCDTLQTDINILFPNSTCTAAPGNQCLCTVPQQIVKNRTDTYSISGTELTLGTSAPVQYCVDNGVLKHEGQIFGMVGTFEADE